MIARLADENGYDGQLFIDLDDNPISLQSIRHLGEQIRTLRIIIAAIEKPTDRSIIPEGAETINIPQLARLLQSGESVVREQNNKGLLPAPLDLGGVIRWGRAEIMDWMVAGCPNSQRWEMLKHRKGA